MNHLIGKSGTGIGKSGTGIGKSGTGIGKSGTGIGKSGTGTRRSGFVIALFAIMAVAFAQPLMAGGDPTIEVFRQGDVLLVSVQDAQGVYVGAASFGDGVDGYHAVELFELSQHSGAVGGASLMVKGSGSGSSGDSVCAPASGLLVKGSGSGSSGDSACTPNAGLLVKGSGSGSSGDSACVPGAGLLVKGSGSGSAGDSAGCASSMNAWGIAEVVVDHSGTHVVINRIRESRAEEYLVAFLPVSNSEVAHSLYRGSSNHGFVAAP